MESQTASPTNGFANGPSAFSTIENLFVKGLKIALVKPRSRSSGTRSASSMCCTICIVKSLSAQLSMGGSSATHMRASAAANAARRSMLAPLDVPARTLRNRIT